MKKIIPIVVLIFSLLSCNDGKDKNDHSNTPDSLNRGVDSGGIKKDPNLNNMNNMMNDSGFKAGGSHTN